MRVGEAWLGGRRATALQFVLLLAAGSAWIGGRAPDLIGSWKQALDFGAGATAFLGPVAAGIACVAYARLRRSAMNEVILQGPRDWLRWLQPALSVWAMASVALLVLTATMTSLASAVGVPSAWGASWILLPALLMLGAHTAIGAAIGFRSGRTWLAPLAVVLVYVLFLLTAVGLFPEVFATGGVTGSLAGATFVAGPVLVPGLAAIGIGVSVLAACHPRLFLATAMRRAVVVAGVLVGLVGWFLAPASSDERYELVAEPRLTCAGGQPEVCVFADTPRPLEDLAGRMHRQARALTDLGVPLPERFAQSYAGRGRPTDGDVVLRDRDTRPTVSDDLATDSLVKPSSSCPADSGPEPPYLAFEVRHLLGRWLQVRAGILTPDPDDRDRAWLTSDVVDQAPWVRTTYRQLSECDFEHLTLPDGLA